MQERSDIAAQASQGDQADRKARAILDAALGRFAAYGYRRTSMEDIAQAAGMSRPALYLHFAGKEAILRALVLRYYDDLAASVAAALSRPDAPEDVLEAALGCHAAAIPVAVLKAPHGQELLESSSALDADLFAEGEARLVALYRGWLEREAAAERLRLEAGAQETAVALLAAAKGAKVAPFDAYPARLGLLARIFGRGLRR